PYAAAQSAFDEILPEGNRYYWKSHFVDDLTDEAIATLTAYERERVNGDSFVVIRTLGGAIDRVAPDDSAFPHRGARFNISLDGTWCDPADDDKVIGWVRRMWTGLRPFANGGV